MRNFVKLIGIAAFVAVIGFSMITCGGGGGGGSTPAPTPTPDGPSDYATYAGTGSYMGRDIPYLLIIEDSGAARAAYMPKKDDKYTLIANDTYTGTVKSFENNVFELMSKVAEEDDEPLTVTVSGNGITAMSGTLLYDDGNGSAEVPATLTPLPKDGPKSIYIIGITGLTGDAVVYVQSKDGKNFVAGNENGQITNGVIRVGLYTMDSKQYTGSASEYVGVGINDKDWYITKQKISITQAITVIPWSNFEEW